MYKNYYILKIVFIILNSTYNILLKNYFIKYFEFKNYENKDSVYFMCSFKNQLKLHYIYYF